MKVIHVLNSREYTGAEKVICQIIRSFEAVPGVEMAYCSPYSDNVREMVADQGIPFLPMTSLTVGELNRVLREYQPDVIHAHDMRASFFSALCCGKTPMISHIHNNAFDARGLSPKSIAYLLAGIRAKQILWVSDGAYEGYLFHRLFAKKSRVLYNILDLQEIQDKLAADENTYDFDIIYVGRLSYEKDPLRLMRLCARVKEQKPDLKVAVVGMGELEAQTKALCAQLGLQENVQFLGFQSNPIKMIHDSKVMVLTSLWEGTPMCVLEAMSMGTPVVSTPSDGLEVLIKNGVNGYLGTTDEELARELLGLLQEPGCREKLGAGALETFQKRNDEISYREAIAACYRG